MHMGYLTSFPRDELLKRTDLSRKKDELPTLMGNDVTAAHLLATGWSFGLCGA